MAHISDIELACVAAYRQLVPWPCLPLLFHPPTSLAFGALVTELYTHAGHITTGIAWPNDMPPLMVANVPKVAPVI